MTRLNAECHHRSIHPPKTPAILQALQIVTQLLGLLSLTHSQMNSWILGGITLGCIQSQSCHTNKCPTGVATQDTLRQRALVVPDKAQRVVQFHRNTLKALAEMLAAAGLEHPAQLKAKHLVRRMSATEIKLFSQLHVFLKPGELLTGEVNGEFYSRMWQMARADSFEANEIAAA